MELRVLWAVAAEEIDAASLRSGREKPILQRIGYPWQT